MIVFSLEIIAPTTRPSPANPLTDYLPSHSTKDGGVTSLLDDFGDIVMIPQIFIPLAMDQSTWPVGVMFSSD